MKSVARDPEWRKKEPGLDDIIKKYPELPKTFILKVDVQRRGVIYTEKAKQLLDPDIHQIQKINGSSAGSMSISKDYVPVGLSLKDGSFLISGYDFDFTKSQRDPYVVDEDNGKVYITDNGEVLEEVGFWEKPDYYDKTASNGMPMYTYATARPQRLDINMSAYCHFWDKPGEGCKYCPFTPNYKKSGRTNERHDTKLIAETVKEALKQKGRFSSILLTGGSVLSGKEILDDEVDGYIELLQIIGENFESGKRFPSQLIATAFNERQLERLYSKTGLMTYTADLEILNKDKFNWICEGKAKHIGFDEWKRRLYVAVDIFGRGNVNSGCVLGCELAQPNGFKTEDEAYEAVVETATELAEHGVGLGANVWRAAPNSILQNQKTPSLDYFIKTFKTFDELHHKYQLGKYIDDYRRCGMHPGNDLVRI